MKKLIIAAAALTAGISMADIQSANIVGYTTKTMNADLQDILGANFIGIGTEALDIQAIFLENGTSSDAISLYVPGVGYTMYTWSTETYKNDYEYDQDLGPGWADGEQIRFCELNENAITLDPGQGFWISMKGTSGTPSMRQSGQVLDSEFETITMQPGLQDILILPYPCDADIQNIVLLNGTGQDAINLYVPGVGYTAYTWSTETYKNDYEYDQDLGPGWADGEQIRFCELNENAITIPAGNGFWISMKGTVGTPQVKFINPTKVVK